MSRAVACWLWLLALSGVALAAQTWRDDFDSYAVGDSGEPAWVADSVMWEMREGAFGCDSPGRTFAVYAAAPFADEQMIEATLTVSGTTTDQWKIAGICVYADDRNYWHLALVESPRGDGARHFVELVEAYEGNWLAENAPETKLTALERRGTDFNWRYDHAYRLRLVLTKERIEATVSELDGQVRSRIGYRLDNPRSVRAGQAALDCGGFAAQFEDFRLEVTSAVRRPERPAPPPVAVPSWPGVRGRASGFFRVEQRGGRWWLFDPRGQGFYIIGTDHANYNVHWCEALGYAPYHRNMAEKFGSEEAWGQSTIARLRDWGFNTLAANHSPSLRYQGLAHIEFPGFGQSFAAHDDICPQVHWTGFPNVFSPKWKERCRKLARQRCAPNRDDPWLIGYFLDNELEWYGKSGRPWGLADEALKKPAEHTAKVALVEFLRRTYDGDIAAFNRAWGTRLRSFDALLRRRLSIGETAAARADKMAFVRVIARRYFAGCARAIREFDPNHLILGCRFAGQAPEIWDIAGKYCDIVSVNCYRQADLERRDIIGFEDDLRRWYKAAQRPLMITEWSFPALDSGLPCKHGAGQRFDTQEQRAAAWRIFQELLFRTPYVVGSDYFMWADEPALGISSTFPEDTNYGLVNERDEPYPELTATARRVNPMAYQFHAGQVAELRPVLGGQPPRLAVVNRGRREARVAVRVWIDGERQEIPVTVPAHGEAEVRLRLPESPGAHFVQCVVDPEGNAAEGDRSDNEAHAAWYVPGLPWPDGSTQQRRPVVISNPSDEYLETALVRVSAPGLAEKVGAWSPQAGWLPCARDASGDTLILTLPDLAAHSARAVLLFAESGASPQKMEPTAAALEVGPGRAGKEEAAALMLGGARVGSIVPLVWQRTPRDQWVRPRLETCGVREAGDMVEIEATLAHRGEDTSGVIGRHDRPEQALDAPRAFRCGYAIIWVRGRPWFTARLLWLRSEDAREWECPGYFHYLVPEFEPEVVEPGVPNYYRPFAGWWSSARNLGIGVMGLTPDDFDIYYWKDERGGLHPDARRDVGRRFKRGARFGAAQPEIVVFAAQGEPLRQASLRIWREARAERMIEAVLAPVEGRGAHR